MDPNDGVDPPSSGVLTMAEMSVERGYDGHKGCPIHALIDKERTREAARSMTSEAAERRGGH